MSNMRRTFRPILEMLEGRLAPAQVVTYHNDNFRTGLNSSETILTPSTIQQSSFGPIFDLPVDGQVYAQPLYMPVVGHNLLFVATESDSVYAFDVKTHNQLWHQSFGTPVPNDDAAVCVQVFGMHTHLGITSTPVIDPSTNLLYVVAYTKEVRITGGYHYVYKLHALSLTTGAEMLGGPVVIADTLSNTTGQCVFPPPMPYPPPGTPRTSDPFVLDASGNPVYFYATREGERTGLALANGVVYTAWGDLSEYKDGYYHGWVLGFDAGTLQPAGVFNTTPHLPMVPPEYGMGGIWMSGGAPAFDSNGNLFLATGDGRFDATATPGEWGDSILRLSTSSGLTVADHFTPSDYDALRVCDADLGSGGVLLIPDQPLLVQTGKYVASDPINCPNGPVGGQLRLINRDMMGTYVQQLPVGEIGGGPSGRGSFDTPAYFNGGDPNGPWIYYAGEGDNLKAYQLNNNMLRLTSRSLLDRFVNPHGATPSISANGMMNGIVWAIDRGMGMTGGPVLLAYLATDLGTRLYTSGDLQIGGIKFATPTIADGCVFVGTSINVKVFGLPTGCAPSTADDDIKRSPAQNEAANALILDPPSDDQGAYAPAQGTAAFGSPDMGFGAPSVLPFTDDQALIRAMTSRVWSETWYYPDRHTLHGRDALFAELGYIDDIGLV